MRPLLLAKCAPASVNVVWMRAAAAIGLVACALVLVACGGRAAKPLSDDQLQSLVLQPSDLPSQLARFSFEREIRSEQDAVLGGDPTRFGRQGGWVARYRRRGNPRAQGPLTVVSTVEMFGRSASASRYLGAQEEREKTSAPTAGLKKVSVPSIGAESHALASARAPRGSVRYVVVTWRDGRFVGSVAASGYAELMSVLDVVALARSQEKRVEKTA